MFSRKKVTAGSKKRSQNRQKVDFVRGRPRQMVTKRAGFWRGCTTTEKNSFLGRGASSSALCAFLNLNVTNARYFWLFFQRFSFLFFYLSIAT